MIASEATDDLPTRLLRALRAVGVGVVLAALAIGLRLALDGYIAGLQFVTYFPAVLIAAYLSGRAAGLVTGALCGLAGLYYSIPPIHSFAITGMTQILPLSLYAAVAVAISVMVGSLRQAVNGEREARRALQAERDLSQQMLNGLSEGFAILDRDYRLLHINAEGLRLDGRTAAEIVGRTHWEAWPGSETHPLGQLYKKAMQERVPIELEHRVPAPSGSTVWLDTRAFPVEPGLAIFWRDVTERHRAEKSRQLLVNELNHRVKNTLAVVQAIAQQTFRPGGPPPDAREAFEGRLVALSHAHDILTRREWSSAPMAEIVGQAMAPFVAREGAVVVEGPDVPLSPRTAVNLALALHELATNAAKYGPLSRDVGRVDIRWTVEDGRLKFVWRETGGPPVSATRRPGFGTRLVTRGLSAEMDAVVELAFEPDGVVCRLEAPLTAGPPAA